MTSFDRSKLTEEKMGKVEEILQDPGYTYENAVHCLKALGGIFKWIKAIRDYYYIFGELEPRRDALILAEQVYNEKYLVLQDNQ